MAESEESLMDSLNENLFNCVICNEKYDQEKRLPKVLPCGHTFCLDCLEKVFDHSNDLLLCPLDREQVVSVTSTESLLKIPNNYLVYQTIDLFSASPSSESKAAGDDQGKDPAPPPAVCAVCESDNPPTHQCLQCNEVYCSSCSVFHTKQKISREHRVLTIQDIEATQDKHLLQLKNLFCKQHTDCRVEFYCMTCHVPICLKCTVIQHKPGEHDNKEIGVAAKLITKEMKEINKKAKYKVIQVKSGLQDVSNGEKEGWTVYNVQKQAVKEHAAFLIDLIEQQEKSLQEDLDYKYLENKKAYKAKEADLEQWLGSVEAGCEFMNQLVTHGNEESITSLYREVKENMNGLMGNFPVLKSTASPPAHFIVNKNSFSLNVGALISSTPSEEKSGKKNVWSPRKQKKAQMEQQNLMKSMTEEFAEGMDMELTDYVEPQTKFMKGIGVLGAGLGHYPKPPPINLGSPVKWQRVQKNKNLQPEIEDSEECEIPDFESEKGEAAVSSELTMHLVSKTGSKGSGDGQLNKPIGIAILGDKVIVADHFNNRLQMFNAHTKAYEGNISFDGSSKQSVSPCSVAVCTKSKRLIVSDTTNKQLSVCDFQGSSFRHYGVGLFEKPRGVVSNSKGYIYAADTKKHCVFIFAPNGKLLGNLGQITSSGSEPGQFNGPMYLAVNSKDDIIVGDHMNKRVQVFTGDTKKLKIIIPTHSRPFGIAVDIKNNILVACQECLQVFRHYGKPVGTIKWENAGGLLTPSDLCVIPGRSWRGYVVQSHDHHPCIKQFYLKMEYSKI